MARRRRERTGRPPEDVPEGAVTARPYLRIPPEVWAAIVEMANVSYRHPSREAAAGIRAYLDAHKVLPAAPELDDTHASTRVQLPANLMREVTQRVGADRREAHLVAALTWWIKR